MLASQCLRNVSNNGNQGRKTCPVKDVIRLDVFIWKYIKNGLTAVCLIYQKVSSDFVGLKNEM